MHCCRICKFTSLCKYVIINSNNEVGDGGTVKIYTIIGGVNGTGKSSLTGVLKTQSADLGSIIDVDKITVRNGGSAIQGGKIALERIDECLKKNLSFTQETTLSGRKTELTAARAKNRGCQLTAPVGFIFYSSSSSLRSNSSSSPQEGHLIEPSSSVS